MRLKILFTIITCNFIAFQSFGQKHFLGLSLEFQQLQYNTFLTPINSYQLENIEKLSGNHLNINYNYQTSNFNHRFQINIPIFNYKIENPDKIFNYGDYYTLVHTNESTLHFIGQYTLSKKMLSGNSIFYMGVFCQPNYFLHTITPNSETATPSTYKKIQLFFGPSVGYELKLSSITSIGFNLNLSIINYNKYFYKIHDPIFDNEIIEGTYSNFYNRLNSLQCGISINHKINSN